MDIQEIKEALYGCSMNEAEIDEMVDNSWKVGITLIDGDGKETQTSLEDLEYLTPEQVGEGLCMAENGTTISFDVEDDSDIVAVVFAPKVVSMEEERSRTFDKVYDMIRDADVALTDFMLKFGKEGRVKALAEILGRARTMAHELNEHYSWD